MTKNKVIYKCNVNGCLGKSLCGKYSGMCKHVGVGAENRCFAHGNLKCVHKVKQS